MAVHRYSLEFCMDVYQNLIDSNRDLPDSGKSLLCLVDIHQMVISIYYDLIFSDRSQTDSHRYLLEPGRHLLESSR